MSWIQILVLAIVQGLTEVLPISSSGHLILVPHLVGWPDQGLVFDVAMHFGSLVAIFLYFREDLLRLIRGGWQIVTGGYGSIESRMALSIGISTLPAAVAGLLFAGWIAENLRDPMVIVGTLSGYGILLALADRLGRQERVITEVRLRDALVIGMAQALALVPGTSRSGITITAGMMLGLRRPDAARFSFLLSAPVILLATLYEAFKLFVEGSELSWVELSGGALVSAVVAYFSIAFFMRFVTQRGLWPFTVYRLALAGFILYVLG